MKIDEEKIYTFINYRYSTWVLHFNVTRRMNLFKFNYTVGSLFTEQECSDILKDLSLQDDRFGISPPIRTGDVDEKLSVYEIDYNDLDNCGGKDTIDRRIKELENRLGLTYNNRFVIKYKDERKEMKPHYDGHFIYYTLSI